MLYDVIDYSDVISAAADSYESVKVVRLTDV